MIALEENAGVEIGVIICNGDQFQHRSNWLKIVQ